ncbi:hypothetical protein [Streptomyces fradiae]|uniref:hypothetical protein n=1 Tax=Streptomyces fradiae TaxID=1906 RepID=UPI0035137A48
MTHPRRLIRAAIEDSGITTLRCECGANALHMIEEFFETLDRDPDSLRERRDWMEGHAMSGSFHHRPAPAVAEILMAALPFYPTGAARTVILEVLLDLSDGDIDDLVEQCQQVIRPGVWLFLEEIASGLSPASASLAFDILLAVEEDDWVAFAREQLSDMLPAVQLDPGYG